MHASRQPDYVFQVGPRDLNGSDSQVGSARLSELFSGPGRPLIVYHFMYGKRNTTACPMCTMWTDTGHVSRRLSS